MRIKKSEAKPEVAPSATKKNGHPSPSIQPHSSSTIRRQSHSPEIPLPETQIDFAELADGSLVDVVEDPTDPNHSLFAVFKRGKVRLVESIEDRGRTLVPIPRNSVGFSDIRLPRGVLPFNSVVNLAASIMRFIHRMIDVPEEYLMLLSIYVLYTWVADRLPIAVYLSLVGLPQSGKSTALEVLSLLCRRALLVTDITQAATYQSCSTFSPTLLIDEVEWRSSRARPLLQLLRAGTSPAPRSLRVRQSGSAFGPKVFSSLEASSDAALNSRSIQLIMAETHRIGLLKPNHPQVLEVAGNLRQRLLKFRFNYYKSIRPAVVPGAERLRPRSRDILSSLAAPMFGRRMWAEFLLYFVGKIHDPATRESLDPRHEALHAALWELIHLEPAMSGVRVGGQASLASATNEKLLRCGERITLTDKAVGRMLASLGFRHTERKREGWILWFTSSTITRCHQLLKSHGNRHVPNWDFAQHSSTCLTCKTFATPDET